MLYISDSSALNGDMISATITAPHVNLKREYLRLIKKIIAKPDTAAAMHPKIISGKMVTPSAALFAAQTIISDANAAMIVDIRPVLILIKMPTVSATHASGIANEFKNPAAKQDKIIPAATVK